MRNIEKVLVTKSSRGACLTSCSPSVALDRHRSTGPQQSPRSAKNPPYLFRWVHLKLPTRPHHHHLLLFHKICGHRDFFSSMWSRVVECIHMLTCTFSCMLPPSSASVSPLRAGPHLSCPFPRCAAPSPRSTVWALLAPPFQDSLWTLSPGSKLGSCRTRLLCFLFLRDHCLLLP